MAAAPAERGAGDGAEPEAPRQQAAADQHEPAEPVDAVAEPTDAGYVA